MLLLEKDGTLIWTGLAADTASRMRATIELPASLLDEQSDLFDRLFAYTFDILGLQTVELRIRLPAEKIGNPPHRKPLT